MGLAAVPLLILAQGKGFGDMHAAMCAAHHRRSGFFSGASALGVADEAAPDPDRCKDDGNPEQQANKAHIVLFCSFKAGSLAKPKASAQYPQGSL
jgi:hypothetical protein